MVRGFRRVTVSPIASPIRLADVLAAGKEIFAKTKRLEDITYDNLITSQQARGNIDKVIRDHYKGDIKVLVEKYKLKVPPLVLLRADVGEENVEEHPLLRARSRYLGFRPSAEDWRREITLPLDIGRKEAQILGVIFGDGSFASKTNVVILNGNSNDIEFYTSYISPTLESIFGIPAPVTLKNYKTKLPVVTKESSVIMPRMGQCSKAMKTWLFYDMGFPDIGEISKKLPEKEQKRAFVEGYLASKGQAQYNRALNLESFQLRNVDKEELEKIISFIRELGMKVKGPYELHMNHEKVQNFNLSSDVYYGAYIAGHSLDGLQILNPRHQRVLTRHRDCKPAITA